MLVACRLAGLSALVAHYAGVRVGAQFGAACWSARPSSTASSRLAAKNQKIGTQ